MRHGAAFNLRDRESRGGNRNANVGGHRKFESFVEGVAVDDCHGRLREHGERLDQARINGFVEANAERGACARERKHARSVVVLEVLEQLEHAHRHRGREDCARAGKSKSRTDASTGDGNVAPADRSRTRNPVRSGFFSGARRQTPPTGARRSLRRILPSGFLGNASINSMRSGRLKLASRERQNSASSASVTFASLRRTTKALTICPHSTDGTPTTAHSSTAG